MTFTSPDPLYNIKAGTRRIDGSEKSNVSVVTITAPGCLIVEFL
jgi:hypothetical protein